MAIRNCIAFLLIILFPVGLNGNDDGAYTQEIMFTTWIPESEVESSSAPPELTSNIYEHVTVSSLQTTLTYTEKEPGYFSKIHKCGFIDSCYGRCGSGPSDRDSIYTYLVTFQKPAPIRISYICFCDPFCSVYGDCCGDYNVHCRSKNNEMNGQTNEDCMEETIRSDEGTNVNPTFSTDPDLISTNEENEDVSAGQYCKRDNLECAHLEEVESGSLLIQTKCHAAWKNKKVEKLCTHIDYRDDVAKLFVQGGDGITYRNIFCAECNFIKVFHFWIQDAYCTGKLPDSVNEQPELLSEYLKRKCVTRFRVPFGQIHRPCLKMIDSCPNVIPQQSEWLEKNCVHGHLSLVTTDLTSTQLWGSTLYRNIFCAECNGVDDRIITCPTKDILQNHFLRNSTHRLDKNPNQPHKESTNRIVTNYNMESTIQSNTVIYEESGLVVRIIDTCEDGQVFDPYLGKCRQLYCSEGYVLVRQTCVPQMASDDLDDEDIMMVVDIITDAINETVNIGDEMVITVKLVMEWDQSDEGKFQYGHDHVNVSPSGKLVPDGPIFNDTALEIYIDPVQHNSSHADDNSADMAYEVTVTMVVENPKDMTRNNAKLFADILDRLSQLNGANEMHVYVNDVCINTHDDSSLGFLDILHGNLTDLNYLLSHCRNGNLTAFESCDFSMHTYSSDLDAYTCPIVYVNQTSRSYDCNDNYIFGYDPSIPANEQTFGALVCDPQSTLDQKCGKILLNETEYEILENGSMLMQGSILYGPTEYFLTPEGVQICNVYTNVISQTIVVFFNFTHAQTIMTYTGLTISSVCLSMTLVTYVIFGELRTLPGLNIMSLIVASIGGNITFIISLGLTPGSMECQITAVILHYFFLTRVFWTNAIVVHAFQTFGPKIRGCVNRSFDVLRRSNTRSRLRQHAPYALYAWCTPMIFAALGSAWHFCACGNLPVYYGLYFSCWIADPYSFLYLFMLPLTLLLATNAILFVPIIFSLHKARKMSRKKLSTQSKSGIIKDTTKKTGEIAIYAKLSTTAGFSWFFGIMASFSYHDFFWYLFILVMSLEGLFIFLSFFCTRRVMNLYSKRFLKTCKKFTVASQNSGHSRGVYAISNQIERRNSNTPKDKFRSLDV